MLKFNFYRLLKARGIERPFSYLVKNGFSSNLATRIARNQVYSLNLTSLERYCDFFHCTPNDLLEWIPGANDINIEQHHLFSLRRTHEVNNLLKLMHSIPQEKLEKIKEYIAKEIEENNI
ncbi:MAG: helix-turn-helix transcriptional regulator [Bacteroidales bacterium]|nr:helix-turn-helix transcriptional regulator [Bacteroidales bacterium]